MNIRQPTILIHSGWNRYNFGDVAHTPGLLRLLETYVPEAEVLLWAARYPQWLESYILPRFPNTRIFSGELGGAHGKIDEAVEEAFDHVDLFIYNSGPIFNYGHELVGGEKKLTGWRGFDWNATMGPVAKLYYARSKNVPFGIFGQSFIYFAPPADVVIPEILSQATFLSTRESDSLQYLKRLGVNAPEMRFTPDAAWAFDLKDDDTVLPWLAGLGLESQRYLAVTTRNAPAGVDEAVDKEKQIVVFVRVVTDWVDATGLPVVLVPETVRSITLNKEYILNPLPDRIKRHVVADDSLWLSKEGFWTPDQALSVLSRAHSCLNVDHHGTLIAMPTGVPCLHPRQPQAGRKSWVYHDIGLSDWLFDLYTVSPKQVSDTLLSVYRDYDGACSRVKEAVRFVRDAHEKQMRFIRSLLSL